VRVKIRTKDSPKFTDARIKLESNIFYEIKTQGAYLQLPAISNLFF
jgi:hypothetical protein